MRNFCGTCPMASIALAVRDLDHHSTGDASTSTAATFHRQSWKAFMSPTTVTAGPGNPPSSEANESRTSRCDSLPSWDPAPGRVLSQ